LYGITPTQRVTFHITFAQKKNINTV